MCKMRGLFQATSKEMIISWSLLKSTKINSAVDTQRRVQHRDICNAGVSLLSYINPSLAEFCAAFQWSMYLRKLKCTLPYNLKKHH
jgi:hypothetical protein